MENETYEQEPVVETGMQEDTELEGVETNQESETESAETETIEEADSQPENPEEPKAEEDKPETEDAEDDQPAWFQKRINKLTSKRKNAEKEADLFRSENEALRQRIERLENPSQPEGPELSREDFSTDKEYMDYAFDLREKKREAQVIQQQQAQGQKIQAQKRAQQDFVQKLETVKDTLPKDYNQVIQGASNVPIPQSVAEVIGESDCAPELLYYFAKNPNEAHRVDGLSGYAKFKFFMEIEKDIQEGRRNGSAKPTTQAPKPAPKPKQVLRDGPINLDSIASKTSTEKFGNQYYQEYLRKKRNK